MAEMTPEMRAEMRRAAEASLGRDFTITVSALPKWLCDWFAASDQRSVLALLDHCDRLERERDKAREEAGHLIDKVHDLEQVPWPSWATECLRIIRSYSGYDGYDDAYDGVDLPSELEETLSEMERTAEAHHAVKRAIFDVHRHEAAASHYRKQAEHYRTALSTAHERMREMAELVECLVNNDPDEPISDAGHVVLDLWRHDAARVLADYQKGNADPADRSRTTEEGGAT